MNGIFDLFHGRLAVRVDHRLLVSVFAPQHEQGQQRFCDASVEAYLARVDALRVAGVPVGVAPHSVRAVPESWLRPIADYSRTYALPLHIHADEQRAEIEQCQQIYGCTPIELLKRYDVLGPLTSIIHATHANEVEIALLEREGCTVCVCPTTEADLGDGIAPYTELAYCSYCSTTICPGAGAASVSTLA